MLNKGPRCNPRSSLPHFAVRILRKQDPSEPLLEPDFVGDKEWVSRLQTTCTSTGKTRCPSTKTALPSYQPSGEGGMGEAVPILRKTTTANSELVHQRIIPEYL